MSAISAGTIFLVPSSTPTLSAAGFAGDSSVLSATWIVAPTSTASAFDDGSSSASFSPSASPEYLIANAVDMLNTALGALVIGLVLASVTFGVVGTKALTYFRGRNGDSGLVKTALAGLLLLNEIQLIATIRAVYTAVVVDFGRFSGLVDNEWSTMIQTFLVTLTAAVAQVFFALRLHAIKRNALLTLTILSFTSLQLVMSIVSVAKLYNDSFAFAILLDTDSMWPTVTTYSLASGINIVIASIAYVWTQKAYVLQKQGRTTFADEFEYWTVKSLFACALVSLFNAVAAGVMAANLTWLAGTFFLGNLYTLSVLLTLGARFPHAPVVMTFPSAPVLETASYRTSTATLTDAALWEDIVKSQAMKASIVSIPKEAKLPDYASGYRVNDGAV